MSVLKKVKTSLLNVSGYLVLLLQQIPPLGVYPALMTLPVFLYLLLLASQFPWSIPNAIIAHVVEHCVPVIVIVGVKEVLDVLFRDDCRFCHVVSSSPFIRVADMSIFSKS